MGSEMCIRDRNSPVCLNFHASSRTAFAPDTPAYHTGHLSYVLSLLCYPESPYITSHRTVCMPFYTPRCQPPYVTSYDPPAFRFTPLFISPNPLIFPPNQVSDLARKKKKRRRIRHPASKRKGLENLRKNKQPNEKQYTKRHKSKVRPDRLSVRFPQAKGISGFGNPAEKKGQKRKRKIKLNGLKTA